MAGSRTLKLSILAETKDLLDGLDKAGRETDSFGNKVEQGFSKFGKAVAAAGIALGAFATKLAIDGVKAALEDEAAQAKLAATLQNVTNATDQQIASVEEYIYQTSIAVGVTDDELRPSFERLFRSVKNIDEAIRLQTLALDISAGSGKSLAQVSEALAKAYDGNFGALKRLGGGIDESIIKNKDFDAAVLALSKTFSGQADVAANTYQGKITRLKIAFNEAKESIGAALLPQIDKLTTTLLDNAVPAFNAFINGLTGKSGVKSAVGETSPRLVEMKTELSASEKVSYELGVTMSNLGSTIADVFKTIDAGTGGEGSSMNGFIKAIKAVNFVLNLMSDIIDGILRGIKAIIKGADDLAKAFTRMGDAVGRLNPFNTRVSYDVPNMSAPSTSSLGSASANYITVNGAIDPEGTARTIINVLNNSQSRGTLGAGALAF